MEIGNKRVLGRVSMHSSTVPNVYVSHILYMMCIIPYSTIGFSLRLERDFSTHLYTHYLPSASIVIVSFISFFIPAEAIPGRIALLVTLFLALITFFGDVQVTSDCPTA